MTQSAPAAPTNDLEKIQEQYQQILDTFQSIQLATVSEVCEPTASYSPSVQDEDGNFYIYVSEIADHTPNLLANGQASILIIEDEGTAGQIFARKRLGFKASASEVERGSEAWESMMERFVSKFGRVMEHLKTMEDFHLFKLAPQDGRLVLGFGRAYSISADLKEVVHLKGIDGKGHRQAS